MRALVWLAIILAVIWIFEGAAFILVHVFNVLLLFIFAGIIALILTPLVDRMERVRPFRGHRSFTVLLIYAVGIAIVAGAIMLVLPTVSRRSKGLPALLQTIENQLRQHGISFSFASLIKAVNGQQLGVALGVAAAFVSGLVSVVLILVISIYLLIEGRAVVATARNVFPSRQREFDFAALAVGSTVAAYVRGQIVMSFVIGTYTGVALTLVGVKYAILLGIAAFFLEFIPIVGAVVAMALAVVVALVQSPVLALFAAGDRPGGTRHRRVPAGSARLRACHAAARAGGDGRAAGRRRAGRRARRALRGAGRGRRQHLPRSALSRPAR